MVNPNRFYTYAYLREDRTPYYIGKGKGNRVYRKRYKGINPPKDKSKIIFLKQNLTEEEAFTHEIYMISVFGRKDLGTGILYNRTDGGEGTSNPSLETRIKMSQSMKGKNFGKKRSKETREKISEILKNRIVKEETRKKRSEYFKGDKNPSKNPEINKKRRQTMTGRKLSPEHCKNVGKSKRGVKWWNNGEITKFCKECPGDGWVLGRLTCSKKVNVL